MNNAELVETLKKECRRVKMQRNAYEQKLLEMSKKLYKAEVELEMMKKAPNEPIPGIKQEYIPDARAEKNQVIFNTVWPDWVESLTPPDEQQAPRENEGVRKIGEDMWSVRHPSGKWTLPEDHPDNGGALIGQDQGKWRIVYDQWRKWEPEFAVYLDLFYTAPKRYNLDTWTKVQNWYKSLADYRDISFLDFLIKFYPAPDLKK
jgi:hypothetical protein